MTTTEAKLDALMNKIGNTERRMHTALEVGIVDEEERRKSVKEGSIREGPYQVEEARYLMPIEATLSSPTSTCPLTTHWDSGTVRTSHMGEEHNKVKDLKKIYSNIMPPQGSNSNSGKS